MTPERRTTARGVTAAKVTVTDAMGDKTLEGELRDIGRGGLFVASDSPMPVGKRVDVEVHVPTGATIAGMGRVIWIREKTEGDLPAGMGVKFIDVDNEALLAIDRLVGLKKNVRERTVLGMMAPTPKADPPKIDAPKIDAPKIEEPAKVEAPKVEAPRPVGKPRERTMLGIAPPVVREKELSWPDEPPAPPPEPEKEPEPVKAPVTEAVTVTEAATATATESATVTTTESTSKGGSGSAPELIVVNEASLVPEIAVAVEVKKEPSVVISEPSLTPRELPKREGGSALKWIVLLVLIVGVGVGLFVMRDMIFPGPSTTPSASASVSASASASATASSAPSAPPIDTAIAPPIVEDAAAEEIAAPIDASTTTTLHDAGHDGGGDAGHHHHVDAGAHVHAHPKPSSGATDNPY